MSPYRQRATDEGHDLPQEALDRIAKEHLQERCKEWWKRNSLLVIAVALVIVGIGTTWISVQFYTEQGKVRQQAHELCERQRLLSPYSTAYLVRENIYPADKFVYYKGHRVSVKSLALSSIPSRCN